MTDNVINLSAERKAKRLIWVCRCGCTSMRCYADGYVACAECETVGAGYSGEWRARLPAEPAEPRDVDETCFKVLDLDSAQTFLRRRLKAGTDDVVLALTIDRDGEQAVYCDSIEPKHARWLWAEVTTAVSRALRNRKAEG